MIKKVNVRVGPDAISALNLVLAERPCTLEKLQAVTGLAPRTLSKWVTSLRRANLVRIADWQKDSRGYFTIAMFGWGAGLPDVVKPIVSGADRARNWRQRNTEKYFALHAPTGEKTKEVV